MDQQQSCLLEYNHPEVLPNAPLEASNFRKKSQLPPLESKPTIEDILNGIFPPVYFQQEAKWFKKTISSKQPSRDQLKVLQTKLQAKLQARQASRRGICPIRQDVHNELLDELIRQCTINCPQRGLLLMRVRDNLKMTFAAYQTLYQGSSIFGNRKAFASQLGISQLQSKIHQLKKRKTELRNKKILLENELETTQKSFKEISAVEDKRRADELQYLNQLTNQFNAFYLANCNYR